MKTLPPVLVIETLKISSIYPWLWLLDITFPGSGSPDFRLVHNNENITYGGNPYTKFPFTVKPPSRSAKGVIPTWEIDLANAKRVLDPYLWTYNGLNGTAVKMRIVNSGHLTADHSELETDLEVIKGASDDKWVYLTLGGPNYLTKLWPGIRYLANHCNWLHYGGFKGAECNGLGVHTPAYTAATTCDGTLATCRTLGNSNRFGGHPGLNSIGIRVV